MTWKIFWSFHAHLNLVPVTEVLRRDARDVELVRGLHQRDEDQHQHPHNPGHGDLATDHSANWHSYTSHTNIECVSVETLK